MAPFCDDTGEAGHGVRWNALVMAKPLLYFKQRRRCGEARRCLRPFVGATHWVALLQQARMGKQGEAVPRPYKEQVSVDWSG
jgi:hypothetical protein